MVTSPHFCWPALLVVGHLLQPGDSVKCTGTIVDVPIGEELCGDPVVAWWVVPIGDFSESGNGLLRWVVGCILIAAPGWAVWWMPWEVPSMELAPSTRRPEDEWSLRLGCNLPWLKQVIYIYISCTKNGYISQFANGIQMILGTFHVYINQYWCGFNHPWL